MASRKQKAAARRNIKKAQAALRAKRRRPPSHKASRRAFTPALNTARATYRAAKARYHAAGEALGRMEGIHHPRGRKSRKRRKTRHKKSR